MANITKRQAFNKYISGCTYYGLAPEYDYEERTAKQFIALTNTLWRKDKAQGIADTAHSVAKNTESARNYVTQKAGEAKRSVLNRAKALNKLNPVTISINWRK